VVTQEVMKVLLSKREIKDSCDTLNNVFLDFVSYRS
jgi:hypothetical protein